MRNSARIFASPSGQAGTPFLAHCVMVALQILVLSVEVRILMGQQVKAQETRCKKRLKLKTCALYPVPCSLFITALWYNGSTSDSGSECQGSNPCRATAPAIAFATAGFSIKICHRFAQIRF